MPRWSPQRTRIQLKLAIQRTHMLQEKKVCHMLARLTQEALAKRARADIADLVDCGKYETARVKTESLIMDDVCRPGGAPLIQIYVELLELLELYCETLYARFALMDNKTFVARGTRSSLIQRRTRRGRA